MYIAKTKGIRTTVMLCTFLAAWGLLLLFFAQEYWMAVVSLCYCGFGLAGLLVFGNVMIGESADFDELKTNQRREAMFFGTNALFTKPAIGIAHGVLALTLAYSFYSPGAPSQVPQALVGIRMIMGLFPSIALFISLIFIYFYPKLKEVQAMKKKLEELHLKKMEK